MKKKIMIFVMLIIILGTVFYIKTNPNNQSKQLAVSTQETKDKDTQTNQDQNQTVIEESEPTYKIEKLDYEYNADTAGVIFLGDSRTVGMKECISPASNEFFVAKVGMGYSWLVNSAIYQIRDIMNSHPEYSHWKIVTNLGINDISYNEQNYINEFNYLVDNDWSNCELYFVSVNPVNTSKMTKYGYEYISNDTIQNFNYDLKTNIKNVKYINTNTYISNSFNTVDGLHYDYTTYNYIYYYIETLLYTSYN